MSVRVKICGLTRPEDVEAALEAGADMLGFNFYPRSPRHVSIERAAELARGVPPSVWRVGVFVNAGRGEIEKARSLVPLDAIQLHGDEPNELLDGWPCPVIRALRLTSADDAATRVGEVDPEYYLCEGHKAEGYGGVGATFDWSWASVVPRERLFVAGGIKPDNVAAAVRSLSPFAVDVASGIETAPGIKDPALMSELIDNAKAA